MYCSKCGANIADGVAFCSACGQPVPGGPASQPQAAPIAPPPIGAPPLYVAPEQAGWQPSTSQAPVAYAGFWLRFVAIIIDIIVLSFVRMILFMPFGVNVGLRGMLRTRPPQDIGALVPFFGLLMRLFLVSAVIQWLYFALLESSSWQATLGKKALGLEVTDLEGHRISFGRATGRYFAKVISTIILCIGYLMAGFTEKKQALHDMIAGTLVIRKL
jgi:uncharacterized RDD family membrane protein YckC